MRTARWSLILFFVVVGGLSGGVLVTSKGGGSNDPAQPDRGVLSPVLDPQPRSSIVARIDAELGRIVDLAPLGTSLVILGREGWVLHGPETPKVWMRDPNPGSPNWLSRPTAIAADSTRIYVLDAGRSTVSVWDADGNRLPDLTVPRESSLNHRPSRLLLDPDGKPLVTIQRIGQDGSASWAVMGFPPGGEGPPLSHLLSMPSESRHMVFEEPLLALSGASIVAMDPLSHRLSRLEIASGRSIPIHARKDPPLWLIGSRHRREYSRMLNGFGEAASQLSQLPDHWPSVRDFTVAGEECLILAVSAGENRQHVEALTPELAPVGRFNREGFLHPLFLSHGRVFFADEGVEETRIYEIETEICRRP